MNPREIERKAPGCLLAKAITVVTSTESTNDDLLSEAKAGAPHGRVLIADHQRKGRGRVGRSWYSPPRTNLYMSVLLRLEVPNVGALTPYSLVAGLAVAESIRDMAKVDALVKWPNDVLIRGRKVAGILTEATANGHDNPALIIGIGLNVNQNTFPEELEAIATSLKAESGRSFDRTSVAAALLERLQARVSQSADRGVQPVLSAWSELSSTIGRRVRPQDGPEGIAQAVDRSGALVLLGDDGDLHQVVAGLIEEL